ncbi:MAG TPA: glutathione ABC transporter substrate-binding protein [Tissierellales bacterium]|nr:glutathione ABC transporter substrate-binding protein [Tissierellales bacterium]
MFRSKKVLILLVVLLSLTVALSGCSGKKDALVVAQGSDAKTLDPHGSNDQPSSRINSQIYNTLLDMDENMEIGPGLAESWKKIDDETWEFKLVEGVKFHNGEELKASDVKFTFERMMESSEVAHIVEALESVETPDDYTVILKTEYPFGPLLAHLAHPASSILNEKAVTEAGDDYGQKPVGTGPYKLENWESGDSVTLVKFDDYFGEPAKTGKVIFQNIEEGNNRTIGLESGELDIAYDIEPIDLQKVRDHESLELIEEPSLSTSYIGFNTEKEPFDDPLVRKALNYAVDVDEIIDVVIEGAGHKAVSPINDDVFGFNSDLEGYEYDPEKAKELLKEAGYPDGFETTLWTNDNPVRGRITEIVQAQLKEVGIKVEIDTLDWAAYLDRTAQGEHEMFILGWVAVTGDADYGLYPLFHSSQHGGAGNRTFYTNKKVDKLLEKGKKSVDEDERLKAYHEAQEIIVDEAPQLFLYFQTQNAGLQNNVKGFKLHPAGHHLLDKVEID